jgi:hypothetical protein
MSSKFPAAPPESLPATPTVTSNSPSRAARHDLRGVSRCCYHGRQLRNDRHALAFDHASQTGGGNLTHLSHGFLRNVLRNDEVLKHRHDRPHLGLMVPVDLLMPAARIYHVAVSDEIQ